jgi:DNA invertase Pin-like site-specific DNA recombinase
VKHELESLIQALQNVGCNEILKEKYTGTTTDRPFFAQQLYQLQEGDTLVVTKLERLARNT